MKAFPHSLHDFITDFNLQGSDGSVCFEANIEFETATLSIKINTEIQVISFAETGLTFFYLLNPDIAPLGIPETIPYNSLAFHYQPANALIIVGRTSQQASYRMIVFPIEKRCKPHTTAELRKRMWN